MKICEKKFDINLKFYFFLKCIVKINFSEKQILSILELLSNKKVSIEAIRGYTPNFISTKTKKGIQQYGYFNQILDELHCEIDLKLFSFSIRLFLIKPFLLELAKLKQRNNEELLRNMDPLSLEYDKITVYQPYSTRVEGALLSIFFFDCLESENSDILEGKFDGAYIQTLALIAKELKQHGVESNQIFMLMFSESINQSIISDSGSNYEDRIKTKLISIGIPEQSIKKKHDENDKSTEFDFFFVLEGKSYGIGAKRTLRERYKQFIKTTQMTDLNVMIEITLGIDLSEDKVKSIRQYGVYLFVADEIYSDFKYLQNIDGVYSVKQLSLELLRKMGNNS